MGFEQAVLKVEKEKEFQELKGVIDGAFRPEAVEKFLKQVKSAGMHVRDFDAVLNKKLFDRQGVSALGLYGTLPRSDQAQVREFYLSKLEEVSTELRTKYQKIYRYY